MSENFITLARFLNVPEDRLEERLRNFKVQADIDFTEGTYESGQCASVVFPNLPESIRKKIGVTTLEDILELQGEYMDETGGDVFYDEENMTYLEKKCREEKINLSADELATIFDQEMGYLYLIKVIDANEADGISTE